MWVELAESNLFSINGRIIAIKEIQLLREDR